MPIFEFRCLECGSIFEKLFMSSDEKAEMVAKRLYPLTRESIAYPPWSPEAIEKGSEDG